MSPVELAQRSDTCTPQSNLPGCTTYIQNQYDANATILKTVLLVVACVQFMLATVTACLLYCAHKRRQQTDTVDYPVEPEVSGVFLFVPVEQMIA